MTESPIKFVHGYRAVRKPYLHGALIATMLLSMLSAFGQQSKPFPSHWGEPPAVQTRDFVEWPGGYGHGSGTVAKWIESNMAKDAASGGSAARVLYSEDFSTIAVGALPEDFMLLNGEFAVREVEGNKVMEMPGAPIEGFAVMFGPAGHEGMATSVRIQAESKGRRHPAFALGMNGLAAYRLRVVPAKRVLELFRGPEESGEVVASEPFEWKSGAWVRLKLQVRSVGEGEWQVEGRAWMDGAAEPSEWMVSHPEKQRPLPGRPFVAASPYSGSPVRFDDIVVRAVN